MVSFDGAIANAPDRRKFANPQKGKVEDSELCFVARFHCFLGLVPFVFRRGQAMEFLFPPFYGSSRILKLRKSTGEPSDSRQR